MTNTKLLSVFFNARDVLLDGAARFEIVLPSGVHPETTSLVIDIYNLDEATHPHGHVGWWQYPLSALSSIVKGSLVFEKGEMNIHVEGVKPVRQWLNEPAVVTERYLIMAVLRANDTNAILAMDKIPVFQNASEADRFRGTLRYNFSNKVYGVASYIPPAGQTVRIVAPNIFPHDAVGNLCLDLYYALQQNGIAAALYADNMPMEANNIVHNVRRLPDDMVVGDQLLYFFSTYDPILAAIKTLPWSRKIAYYHGVTNPRLLQVFDQELAAACEKARNQISMLEDFDVLAANSHASVEEMFQFFLSPTAHAKEDVKIIAPKLLPQQVKDEDVLQRRKNVLLYVGRLKSHKKIEDVLSLFASYYKLHKDAECWIIGSGGDKAYLDYLAWHERDNLGLPEGVVRWKGGVDNSSLASAYASASAYVSMSEHEGFCLPVFEAMRARLPVFAYEMPALSEVLGESGICFGNKSDFDHLARALDRLLSDKDRLEAFLDLQQNQADGIARHMSGNGFFSLLNARANK